MTNKKEKANEANDAALPAAQGETPGPKPTGRGYEPAPFKPSIPAEMMSEEMRRLTFELEERRQRFLVDFGMAKLIADSGIYGDVLPQEVHAIGEVGQRFGWDMSTSMENIDIIPTKGGNKPSIQSAGMRAVIEASGLGYIDVIDVVSGQGGSVTACGYRTHRPGMSRKGDKAPLIELKKPRTYTATFSIDDAQRAGLTKKGNWKMYPEDMMIARATARVARVLFPDLLAGMYMRDELEEGKESRATQPTQSVGGYNGGVDVSLGDMPGETGKRRTEQQVQDTQQKMKERQTTEEEIDDMNRQFDEHMAETAPEEDKEASEEEEADDGEEEDDSKDDEAGEPLEAEAEAAKHGYVVPGRGYIDKMRADEYKSTGTRPRRATMRRQLAEEFLGATESEPAHATQPEQDEADEEDDGDASETNGPLNMFQLEKERERYRRAGQRPPTDNELQQRAKKQQKGAEDE